ncbi:DUF2470 domain-containing protein [Streptomyces sp. NPDC089915]|uniref:DUF2470 domain-containing protein n=1 Tax=Streptomyces sp. NPDC089915 TaxID=3155186 RepID=UPI00344AED47
MSRPHGIPLPSAHRSSDSNETESAFDDDKQGQPRPREGVRQLTGAERVRTLVESNASVSLTLPGARDQVWTRDQGECGTGAPAARTVTPDGDVILLVPGESAAARAAAHAQDDDLPAVIEITDVAPVSVPHRIRGRARLAGWLTPVRGDDRAPCAALMAERHPVGGLLGLTESLDADDAPYTGRPAWMLLRLEVGEISVDDLWGAERVDPEELAAAEPDPMTAHEAELLQHLASVHPERLAALCGLLGSRQAAGLTPVPLALDRLGLRVRFTRGPGPAAFDARFDFPEPVADVCGLRRAMRSLFAAAAH